MKTKFLRFIANEIHEASRQPAGLFVVAYRLLASGELSPEETESLRDCLAWFVSNVPTPTEPYITDPYIFWFKAEAQPCIQHMWQLADLLKLHGYLVDVQRCQWPGAVLYEDEYQVAARPLKR